MGKTSETKSATKNYKEMSKRARTLLRQIDQLRLYVFEKRFGIPPSRFRNLDVWIAISIHVGGPAYTEAMSVELQRFVIYCIQDAAERSSDVRRR